MKRRIVGAALAACMAVLTGTAAADDSTTSVDPVRDVLKKHCSTKDSEALSVANQETYWKSAEARIADHAKVTDASNKNRVDRWIFDRITAEVGYGSNNTYEISKNPNLWTRNDEGFGAITYELPFSAFREKRREDHRLALLAEQRSFASREQKAAFYAAFLQFRADVESNNVSAAKQALAIGAMSPAFANACLNLSW